MRGPRGPRERGGAGARGALCEVVPPRRLEASPGAAAALVSALAGAEPPGLAWVITPRGPRFLVRGSSADALERALSPLGAAYPQAGVERIDLARRPDLDPARVGPTEEAVSVALGPRGERALPLRAEREGGEPALSVVLAAPSLRPGERILLEIDLEPAPPGEAAGLRRRARATEPRDRPGSPPPASGAAALVLPIAALLAGIRAHLWYEQGELLPLALSGAALAGGAALLALAARRLLRPAPPLDPAIVGRKLASPLFRASVRVLAAGPRGSAPGRLRGLARQVAGALSVLDDPAGGGLRWGRAAAPGGLLLSAEEVASLWHLPGAVDAVPAARRMRARRLPPPPGHARRGAPVGVAGGGAGVCLPPPLLHRNQLVVAKTRRGKSTLLAHLARGLMERSLADPRPAALVVVDPHQDLAEAVLDSMPPALAPRAVYLDMADRERPAGLNLLDVGLFPDRDLATEHVVTVMSRLWPESWGPRMEGALRASVATLSELNRGLPRESQHTLLDVAPLLSSPDYRWALLERLADPVLRAWWRDNFLRLNKSLQQQIATPVTNKVGRLVVTEASRLLLGQARSTVDPRLALEPGGVLVINTASGALGEGASALVGATWLNLLGLMVEEQVGLPAAERRRVVVLVDESSTLGAVDYRRMLSELVKFGASFVLVAQGLAKLDALDQQLAPAILSNVDALTVFQVSAEDARRLAPELGSGLEVEDLTGLDDFECYARWWDGRARPRAFSFRVLAPPAPAAASPRAEVAARSAARFGRPRREVAAEVARALAAPERWAARPPRPLPPAAGPRREGALPDGVGPGDVGGEPGTRAPGREPAGGA